MTVRGGDGKQFKMAVKGRAASCGRVLPGPPTVNSLCSPHAAPEAMAIRAATLPTQADWAPDARGQAVLSAIIKEHLRTGEPVASRSISGRFAGGAGWSSATIRNVMAELEEHGLVEQPHTSAGRVPTDKGYRFYVDHFIGDARLSRADISAIDRGLGLAREAGAQPDTPDGARLARPLGVVARTSASSSRRRWPTVGSNTSSSCRSRTGASSSCSSSPRTSSRTRSSASTTR